MAFPIGINNGSEMTSYMMLRPSLYGSQSAPSYREPRAIKLAIEQEDYFILIERARKGDLAAQAELRFRGNNTSR